MGNLLKINFLNSGMILLLLLAILTLVSCAEEGCQESRIVKVNARFFDKASNEPLALTLTLKGVDNDSLLLDSVVKVSSFELFLKQDTSFTAYVLSFPAGDVDNDTLFIRHINKDKIISMDCGCATFSTIESIYWSRHTIDSLAIRNKVIGTSDEENIRIYF